MSGEEEPGAKWDGIGRSQDDDQKVEGRKLYEGDISLALEESYKQVSWASNTGKMG